MAVTKFETKLIRQTSMPLCEDLFRQSVANANKIAAVSGSAITPNTSLGLTCRALVLGERYNWQFASANDNPIHESAQPKLALAHAKSRRDRGRIPLPGTDVCPLH